MIINNNNKKITVALLDFRGGGRGGGNTSYDWALTTAPVTKILRQKTLFTKSAIFARALGLMG